MPKSKPIKKQKLPKEADYELHDLFRHLIGVPLISDSRDFDALTGEDRIRFLKYCSSVYQDVHFEMIIKHLMFEFVMKAGIEAKSFDEVLVNRASVNGISMMQGLFAKYNKKYEEEFAGKEESFDPGQPFDPLDV